MIAWVMRAGNVHWLAGVVLLLGPGCYKSYEVEARGGLDAGADSTLDTGIDGRIDGSDAAPDTRPPLPDAMPIEEPPPPPGRCRTDPVVAPFRDPVLEWRWPTGSVVHGDAVHVCSTPLVIDLEPGGETVDPVLAFVSYPPLRVDEPPGILRIVDPRTNTTVSYPPNEGELGLLEATTNLAAGDINNDGLNEIVGIGRGSGTYAFRSDGTLLWSSFYPLPSEFGTPPNFTAIGGAVSLADLEGDGTVEVVVGRTVLEGATGEHRWTGPSGTARGINQFLGPISCVADLNGDGNQEVIAGHTAFRADGSIYWSNDELFDGLCAVADVYPAIPGPEVVLSGNGYVRVLNGRTGAVEWLRQLEGRVRLSLGGAPTVADFDGDGDVEFGIAHGAAYGVYDPSCSENPRPSGCRGDGLLWKDDSTADDSSSGTGSSVFDFNGDGRAEVVYNDQFYFRVYDGTNGRALFQHRNSSRTRTENPTIADIDNDGDAEIIFSANAEAFFIREFYTDPGVEVWGDARGRWVGARRIWNQHAYNISNVEEDGTIPRNPSS
ncbi:MAG: VCBS repeat-containing protein, partial [Myxococcota bacterium]